MPFRDPWTPGRICVASPPRDVGFVLASGLMWRHLSTLPPFVALFRWCGDCELWITKDLEDKWYSLELMQIFMWPSVV
jgi:hypothetical protein